MYRNLMAEMARAGIMYKEMAEKLGIRESTYSFKVNGKVDWKLKEMLAVQKVLNEKLGTCYTLDYLFKV